MGKNPEKQIIIFFVSLLVLVFFIPMVVGDTYVEENFDGSAMRADNTEVSVFDGENVLSLKENTLKGWLQSDWSQGSGVSNFPRLSENAYKTEENISAGENVELESVGAKNVAGSIVISDLSAGTTGSNKEYIELYNPNDFPENLRDLSSSGSGELKLKLVDSGNNITNKSITWINDSIPAHGYFLLASAGSIGDVSADAVFSDQMTDESGAIIADGNNESIDKVAWGASVPPSLGFEGTGIFRDLGTGDSIERKSNSHGIIIGKGNGYDTENNSNDFVYHSSSYDPKNSSSPPEAPPSPFSYKSSGYLKSLIFDAGMPVSWENIKWSFTEPTSTIESINNVDSEPMTIVDGDFRFGTEESGSISDAQMQGGYRVIGENGAGQSWTQSSWVGANAGASAQVITKEKATGYDDYYSVENIQVGPSLELDKTVAMGTEANLLGGLNPGFESTTSLEGWEELGTESKITRSSTHAYSGSYSCRFSDLTSSYYSRGIRSNTENDEKLVFPGEDYLIGAWFYADNSDGGSDPSEVLIRIYIEWHDNSWNYLSKSGMDTGESISSLNAWENKSVEGLTAPAHAAYGKLRIDAHEAANNNYDLYVDNAEIFGPVGVKVNKTSGYLESSVYDSGSADTKWDQVSWAGEVPSQTNLEVWLRFDNSLYGNSLPSTGTGWVRASSNSFDLSSYRARYIQYKVVESTDDVKRTPVFESIEIKTISENQTLRWEHRIENIQVGWQSYDVKVKGHTSGDSEKVSVKVWNNADGEWESVGNLKTMEKTITKTISGSQISDYLDGGDLSVKYESEDNIDSTKTKVHIDCCFVRAENTYATSASVYARASSDGLNWGGWEGPYSNSPASIGLGDNRYIQYKVDLSTEDNSITSSLENIGVDYSLTPKRGIFISQPVHTGYVSNWELSWDENVPSGSSLDIRTRSSENVDNDQLWSSWSNSLDDPEGTTVPSPSGGKKYLQIKAELSRADLSSPSPKLESLRLTYTPDNKPPKIEDLDKGATSSEARISAVLSDKSPIDSDSIELYLDGRRLWPSYNPSTGEVVIEPLLKDGVYSVNLKVADHHGLMNEKSWSFIVRSDPPNPPLLDDIPATVGKREIEVTGTLDFKEEVGGGWSEKPSNPPEGVSDQNGHRMTVMNGEIYFWTARGGKPGTAAEISDNFYKYDPSTDSWIQLTDAPFGSAYGIGTAYGVTSSGENAVYIIKGHSTGQKTWFVRYTESGGWETLDHSIPFRRYPDVEQDYPRNGSTLVWDRENYIYFFPGSGYDYKQHDWYRYDIINDSWEYSGELPMWNGVGNAATFVENEVENYIYAIIGMYHFGEPYLGGYNSDYNGAKFMRYGLSSENWEVLDNCGPDYDHPYGADDGSALVWDDGDYIYHAPGAYEEMTQDLGENQKRILMRYSISDENWTEVEKAPYNEYGGWDDGGGIVLVNDTIYALKGGDDVAWVDDELVGGGTAPANNFWSYSLPQTSKIAENKVWIYLNDRHVATAQVSENGTFSAKVKLSEAKSNEIKARTIDLDGEPSAFSEVQTVELDLLSTMIKIHHPPDGFFRCIKELDLSGGVSDSSVDNVTVVLNGKSQVLEVLNGEFEATLTLENGTNLITVRAEDAAGNSREVSIEGTYALAPPKVSLTVKDLVAGKDRLVVFKDRPFIEEIRFFPERNLDEYTVTIESVATLPSDIAPPSPAPYAYMRINPDQVDTVEKADISFRVEKYSLDAEGIGADTISLYRHENGIWKKLATEFEGARGGWYYYTAEASGFSLFTISGEYVTTSSKHFPRELIMIGFILVVGGVIAILLWVNEWKLRKD